MAFCNRHGVRPTVEGWQHSQSLVAAELLLLAEAAAEHLVAAGDAVNEGSF